MHIVNQQQRIERIAQTGYEFNPSDAISEGWTLFRKNPGPFVIYAFIVVAISLGGSMIPIVGSIAVGVIGPVLTAGWYLGARKLDITNQVETGDFFKSFDFFVQLLLGGIVGGLLTLLGTILLILPGIWIAVGIVFVYQLIVFAGIDFWEAIKLSIKVITKQWWSFFGFVILIFLINLLGVIALGVGLLISIPVSYLAIYCAYKKVIGFEEGSEMKISDHLVDDRI